MIRVFLLALWFIALSGFTGPKVPTHDPIMLPIENPQTQALNNYVNFINESIHGLLIVHRLLENFNLDINKYVDLDSYQINFYSNRDLPKDIFDDPDNWFYNTSPYEWYEKTQLESTVLEPALAKKLNANAAFMKDLISKANQKRFDIEEMISGKDLSDIKLLQAVYDELESCVDLFKSFFTTQLRMEKMIYQTNFSKPVFYQDLARLYTDYRGVLLTIRKKEDKRFDLVYRKLATTVNTFRLSPLPKEYTNNKIAAAHIKNIVAQAQKGMVSSKAFRDNVSPTKDYEYYGAHYYYYNSDIINKFNRYGSGIVFEINELLNLLNFDGLLFTELPHYYKVIYPRKLEKINAMVAEAKDIDAIPPELEGRKVKKKDDGAIKVDRELIEIEIYDHMIQDGDIVSLNFNGEWVLRRHRLTSKPMKLKLKLNNEGKNYLVLHAENMGQRPPNTMALSYFVNGKRQLYVMNSDLNTSEVIEIIN